MLRSEVTHEEPAVPSGIDYEAFSICDNEVGICLNGSVDGRFHLHGISLYPLYHYVRRLSVAPPSPGMRRRAS